MQLKWSETNKAIQMKQIRLDKLDRANQMEQIKWSQSNKAIQKKQIKITNQIHTIRQITT